MSTVEGNASENKPSDSANNGSAGVPTSVNRRADAEERLVERRRSFVPMSSMEEESLRERMYIAQLKKCAEIVKEGEGKYYRDTFRRLFTSKVGYFFSNNFFNRLRLLSQFSVNFHKLDIFFELYERQLFSKQVGVLDFCHCFLSFFLNFLICLLDWHFGKI